MTIMPVLRIGAMNLLVVNTIKLNAMIRVNVLMTVVMRIPDVGITKLIAMMMMLALKIVAIKILDVLMKM